MTMIRLIICTVLNMALASHAATEPRVPPEQPDLTELPIEHLLIGEIYTACKFVPNPTGAPAAVIIISTLNIPIYGHYSLAGKLTSLPDMARV